jgi:BirA family transcriptional regulator, biotin operon repressor / biotin---[acetyl-CoA-carboxylase] ligase
LKSQVSAADRLDGDRLRAALGSVRIGCTIVVLDETGSTNDVVRELANKGLPEGLAVFAEHQTAGRGQRGKKWESAPGKGLWLSVLLKPAIRVGDSARLTAWAARTVALTIEEHCRLNPTIKLPNDIYIDRRKLAGVLVEMRAQPQAAHMAILGIGLNVNQTLEDFPKEIREQATSVAIATGHRQDRNELAIALLQNLDRTYGQAVL